MKRFLVSLLLGLAITTPVFATNEGVITLDETNSVSLQGEVDDSSITQVILDLENTNSKVIYLVIDSPGGNVIEGNRLIQYFATTDKNIVCVAKIAVSMAHQIMQACPKRVGTPDNIMMQHRMTAGIQGNVDQMQGLNEVFRKLEIQLNNLSAHRIGISLSEFFKKVDHEWWTFGKESKELNIVDSIAHVKCTSSLYKKDTATTVQVFIFRVPVLKNGCPLMPIRIDDSKLKGELPQEVIDRVLMKFPLTFNK